MHADLVLQAVYNEANVFSSWENLDGTPGGLFRDKDRNATIVEIFEKAIRPFASDAARADGDEGWAFFEAAPVGMWVFLFVTCALLCLLDWGVLRHAPDTFWWHAVVIVVWLAVALIFNLAILVTSGKQQAFEWATGYVLEWMLSMDNLFVFHLVFQQLKTPAAQIHTAVFVGIIGAVVMRMAFFMVVSTLLHLFGWFRWPFGCLLVWSGIEAARADNDDESDPTDCRLVKGLTWLLGDRLHSSYDDGARLLIFDGDGRWKMTLLVVVIACLEFTDILFALDSVSAKVAQIPDQFVAFSSSVIAMYGLRAMFFIIHDLVDMFDMLKYGLCVILVFIGLELMFARFLHLESSTVCILILAVFFVCIIGSQARKASAGKDSSPALDKERTAAEDQDAGSAETPQQKKAPKKDRDAGSGETSQQKKAPVS